MQNLGESEREAISSVVVKVFTIEQRFYSIWNSKWYNRLADFEGKKHANFLFGNPTEMAPQQMIDVFAQYITPKRPDWYAYRSTPEKSGIEAVLKRLNERVNVQFSKEDVCFTNGAFAGLFSSLRTVTNPGDEVIFFAPCWFFYDSIITFCEGTPVKVDLDMKTNDIDLSALRAAITSKTRAVIINSPHNPTGKVYSAETLQGVADILRKASQTQKRSIYLISDEAYSRIVFEPTKFQSPVAFYENTFLVFTYTKSLLAPGRRVGYVAISPKMNHIKLLRQALNTTITTICYSVPNADVLYGLADLENNNISVDFEALRRRRDILCETLHKAGYEFQKPEGTLYIWVKCPINSEDDFCDALSVEGVFVVPGNAFFPPTGSWFRICLSASDEMVKYSIPVFQKVIKALKGGAL